MTSKLQKSQFVDENTLFVRSFVLLVLLLASLNFTLVVVVLIHPFIAVVPGSSVMPGGGRASGTGPPGW